jgi:hypothetical protein
MDPLAEPRSLLNVSGTANKAPSGTNVNPHLMKPEGCPQPSFSCGECARSCCSEEYEQHHLWQDSLFYCSECWRKYNSKDECMDSSIDKAARSFKRQRFGIFPVASVRNTTPLPLPTSQQQQQMLLLKPRQCRQK